MWQIFKTFHPSADEALEAMTESAEAQNSRILSLNDRVDSNAAAKPDSEKPAVDVQLLSVDNSPWDLTDVPPGKRAGVEAVGAVDDPKAAAQRLKRAEKAQETRQLDPWERYRALTDLVDVYVDMIEIADRKALFSLFILGAINSLNLVIAARPALFTSGDLGNARWVGIYAAVYISVSIYLLMQSIGALRPRVSTFLGTVDQAVPNRARLPHLRFIGDAVAQTAENYYAIWRNAEIGQLNREVALHVQDLARINTRKYKALDRVYNGLSVLALLTLTLVVAILVRGFGV